MNEGYISKSTVIPPNSNTFSDWRRACHVSWLKTPKGNNDLNFRLARDQVVHFKTAANLYASRVKQIIFMQSWQLWHSFKEEIKQLLRNKISKSTNDVFKEVLIFVI